MTSFPKDHYVPQCYLDAFSIEGAGAKETHIYQYMENGIVSPRIKDVAAEKHFYTFKHKDTGEPVRDVDDTFTMVEGWTAPILKKIIDGNSLELSDEEHEKLSLFISFLIIRTPGYIKHLESLEGETTKEMMALDARNKEKFHESFKNIDANLTYEEVEKQREYITSKKYSIEYPNSRGHFIAQGFKHAMGLAGIFYEVKHWHLLTATKEEVFITSDNPVSLYRPIYIPKIYGAGYRNGTIVLSISPKHAILLRDFPLKSLHLKVGAKSVIEINKNLMRFSDNYIFSNLKSKKIHNTYISVGNKHHQTIKVQHHKFAPYIFIKPENDPPEEIIS